MISPGSESDRLWDDLESILSRSFSGLDSITKLKKKFLSERILTDVITGCWRQTEVALEMSPADSFWRATSPSGVVHESAILDKVAGFWRATSSSGVVKGSVLKSQREVHLSKQCKCRYDGSINWSDRESGSFQARSVDHEI